MGGLRKKLEAAAVKHSDDMWEGAAAYYEEEIAQSQVDFMVGARITIGLLLEEAEKESIYIERNNQSGTMIYLSVLKRIAGELVGGEK